MPCEVVDGEPETEKDNLVDMDPEFTDEAFGVLTLGPGSPALTVQAPRDGGSRGARQADCAGSLTGQPPAASWLVVPGPPGGESVE